MEMLTMMVGNARQQDVSAAAAVMIEWRQTAVGPVT